MDAPDDKAFVLNDKRLHNLNELLIELKMMDDETYSRFVSSKHNYFADWVLHVLSQKDLAEGMRKSSSKKNLIELLESRKGRVDAIEIFKAPKKDVLVTEPAVNENGKEAAVHTTEAAVPEKKTEPQKADQKNLLQQEPPKKKGLFSTGHKEPVKKNIEQELEKIEQDEKQIKELIYKHFSRDMAKEFMYGMALGIIMGLILSRIILP
ncbi:MAG: hypothetical protein NDI94_05585 [Candidatus Woesearchaeota archaeon]|nr:hypothetical protein [Candidatus Woesearchaeota archaeon]